MRTSGQPWPSTSARSSLVLRDGSSIGDGRSSTRGAARLGRSRSTHGRRGPAQKRGVSRARGIPVRQHGPGRRQLRRGRRRRSTTRKRATRGRVRVLPVGRPRVGARRAGRVPAAPAVRVNFGRPARLASPTTLATRPTRPRTASAPASPWATDALSSASLAITRPTRAVPPSGQTGRVRTFTTNNTIPAFSTTGVYAETLAKPNTLSSTDTRFGSSTYYDAATGSLFVADTAAAAVYVYANEGLHWRLCKRSQGRPAADSARTWWWTARPWSLAPGSKSGLHLRAIRFDVDRAVRERGLLVRLGHGRIRNLGWP